MQTCLWRSVPEIHWHVAGTLRNQQHKLLFCLLYNNCCASSQCTSAWVVSILVSVATRSPNQKEQRREEVDSDPSRSPRPCYSIMTVVREEVLLALPSIRQPVLHASWDSFQAAFARPNGHTQSVQLRGWIGEDDPGHVTCFHSSILTTWLSDRHSVSSK